MERGATGERSSPTGWPAASLDPASGGDAPPTQATAPRNLHVHPTTSLTRPTPSGMPIRAPGAGQRTPQQNDVVPPTAAAHRSAHLSPASDRAARKDRSVLAVRTDDISRHGASAGHGLF